LPQFSIQTFDVALKLLVIGTAEPTASPPMIIRNMNDFPACALEDRYSIKVRFRI